MVESSWLFNRNEAASCAILAITLVVFGLWAAFWYKKVRSVFLTGERQQLTLVDKVVLNSDTLRLRFELDFLKQKLGLPAGQHILFFAPNATGQVAGEWNGNLDGAAKQQEVRRPYTPITGDETEGYVDFIIKVYRSCDSFCDGGKCTQFLENLEVGDKLSILGPVGKIVYGGEGCFKVNGQALPSAMKKISMIAGGSGITPMLQLMKIMLEMEDDTEVALIFGNRTEDDIVCREMLDDYAKRFPKRFKVWYTVDNAIAAENWKYSTGYVTKEMIEAHLFRAAPDTACCICGPAPLCVSSGKMVGSIGYASSNILKF